MGDNYLIDTQNDYVIMRKNGAEEGLWDERGKGERRRRGRGRDEDERRRERERRGRREERRLPGTEMVCKHASSRRMSHTRMVESPPEMTQCSEYE